VNDSCCSPRRGDEGQASITAPRTIQVRIGGRELRLSPLPPSDWTDAAVVQIALAATQPGTAAWIKAHEHALGYIFVAARRNHTDLSLADLHDAAEREEIEEAFKTLGQFTALCWKEETSCHRI
jgi:hypothetical protein